MSTSEQAETATTRREIPLAYDANGEPLNVPESAIGWRVRRGGGRRGRPRIVFNHDGRQLEIGIESTIHDLADHDCAPGRYKLEAVTADGRLIPGCVAVTEIPVDDDDDGPDGQGGSPAPMALSVWDEAYKELHDRRRAMNEQTATFCRAFEAMAHAFGPVRALGGVSMPELPTDASDDRCERGTDDEDGSADAAHHASADHASADHGRSESRRGAGGGKPRRGGRWAVILDPTTDRECLAQVTTMARELSRTTLVHLVADRLGTPTAVAKWLQSLPQSDDDGGEPVQYVACDVAQRLRLFPRDPNCFERTFAALTLLEVLDAGTQRMAVTIERPARHTGVVELRGGHWNALDLFPRRNFDWGNFGKNVLQGVQSYVAKPVLKYYGLGSVADTVGDYENKLIGRDKPAEKKDAPPSGGAQTGATKPRQSKGGTNGQEAAQEARESILAAIAAGAGTAGADFATAGPWHRDEVEEAQCGCDHE